MMRLAAVGLLALLVAFPLTVLPAAPVNWLAGGALLVGGAGVALLLVPLVTAGAAMAIVAYALALVIVQPAADPIAAITFGALLVVLLALAHLAARVDGAVIGPAVIVAQVRQWLVVVGIGVVVAGALAAGGGGLAGGLQGMALPVVVVTAALGAVLAVGAVIALVMAADS